MRDDLPMRDWEERLIADLALLRGAEPPFRVDVRHRVLRDIARLRAGVEHTPAGHLAWAFAGASLVALVLLGAALVRLPDMLSWIPWARTAAWSVLGAAAAFATLVARVLEPVLHAGIRFLSMVWTIVTPLEPAARHGAVLALATMAVALLSIVGRDLLRPASHPNGKESRS